jgi:hypothetical protein
MSPTLNRNSIKLGRFRSNCDVHQHDQQRPLHFDLTRSPRRPRMTAICAFPSSRSLARGRRSSVRGHLALDRSPPAYSPRQSPRSSVRVVSRPRSLASGVQPTREPAMEPLGHAPSGPASFASERRVAASRAWQNAYEPSPAFTEPDSGLCRPGPRPWRSVSG